MDEGMGTGGLKSLGKKEVRTVNIARGTDFSIIYSEDLAKKKHD
jgi:hypothetical protein